MIERIKLFFLNTRSFWQAVFLAFVVSLGTFGLYLLCLSNWDYGQISQSDRLIVQLAIGQVFTGFAAIFFTITLGVFAVREFMERRALPNVELFFSDPEDDDDKGYKHLRLSRVSPRAADEQYEVNLQLVNHGPVTAVWYRFELRVPFLQRSHLPNNSEFNTTVGRVGEHWTSVEYAQESDVGVFFSSQGSIVAYPHWPMMLCSFRIHRLYAAPLPRDYICAYRLIVDGQPLKHGELRLTLRNS